MNRVPVRGGGGLTSMQILCIFSFFHGAFFRSNVQKIEAKFSSRWTGVSWEWKALKTFLFFFFSKPYINNHIKYTFTFALGKTRKTGFNYCPATKRKVYPMYQKKSEVVVLLISFFNSILNIIFHKYFYGC